MEVSDTNPAPVDLLAGASSAPPSDLIPAELVRAATGRDQIGRKLGGRSGSPTFARREYIWQPISPRGKIRIPILNKAQIAASTAPEQAFPALLRRAESR